MKFTRRDVKNEFYTNRKKIAGRKISSLKSLVKKGENKVYISESLTPKRKHLFGAVNNIKKKLNWKFIWTNNGRIYLRESDNSVSFTFESIADLVDFENKQHLAPSAIIYQQNSQHYKIRSVPMYVGISKYTCLKTLCALKLYKHRTDKQHWSWSLRSLSFYCYHNVINVFYSDAQMFITLNTILGPRATAYILNYK